MKKRAALWAALLQLCVPAAFAATAAVVVKLNTNTATVHAGETKTFSASVSNSTDKTVTWSVRPLPGSSVPLGSIDANGKYTPPAVIPPNNVVTVLAVSHADNTKSDSAAVTLMNSVPAITAIDNTQINTGLAFTIVITGTNFLSNSTVSFDDSTVIKTKFDSATQLEASGTTATAAGQQIHVTVVNPGSGATTSNARTLSVIAPVTVTVSPKTKTIRGGTAQAFSASVHNNKNTAVTWSVNGVAAGNATLGKIDATGNYTAPIVIPGASVTITATSVADTTKSDAAALSLQNPMPVITTATTPLRSGSAATITISGSGFAPGATAILGTAALALTFVDSTKLTASATVSPAVGGVLPLQVSNPAPGAANSNVFAVAVQNPGTKLSYAAAKRFLEQATWGPTPDSIAHLQSIGVDAWLTEQFDINVTPISQYALPIDDTSGLDTLQKEFFKNALTSPDQLRQRVAFALAQIAVVSGVKLTRYAQMMPYQQMLLNDAFGTYRQFLKDVTLTPAMGHYLDMVNNDKPSATNSPNENYARESMQLFSLGLVQLNPTGQPDSTPQPTYTEDDVRALARVFTGWTYPPCLTASKWVNPPCWQGNMVPFEDHHDNTNKTFLGATIHGGTTGTELDAALAIIEAYKKANSTIPNIAPFVSLRLIQHLVTSNPSPAYVSRIATVYANSGGDLKQIVTAILKDTEAGYGNGGADLPPTQGHLREPVFYALSMLRALNAVYIYSPPLASYTTGMGQNLFNSPSVFNYYSPFYHIPDTPYAAPEFQTLSQTTAFARANYAYRAVRNQLSSDVQVDLSNFKKLASDTNAATQTASLTSLLNGLSQALLGGPMSSDMLNAILPALTSTTDANTRAYNAAFLVAVASEYQVQR